MSNSPKYSSGTIFVYFPGVYELESSVDPDYSTTGHNARIYKRICLESYPSSYDFFDAVDTIRPGDIGIILRPIGLPWQLVLDKKIMNCPIVQEKYMVYEALSLIHISEPTRPY